MSLMSTPSNQWISVKDRLPDVDQNVLMFLYTGDSIHKDGTTHKGVYYQEVGYLYKDGVFEGGAYYIKYSELTHWMPLPEPPKTDS